MSKKISSRWKILASVIFVLIFFALLVFLFSGENFNVLKEILHQLHKINDHTDDLYLYRSDNIITKALLQCQIGRLIKYVKQHIETYELDKESNSSKISKT